MTKATPAAAIDVPDSAALAFWSVGPGVRQTWESLGPEGGVVDFQAALITPYKLGPRPAPKAGELLPMLFFFPGLEGCGSDGGLGTWLIEQLSDTATEHFVAVAPFR